MQGAGELKRIRRESRVERTARVMQLEGLFDVPASKKTTLEWSVRLPLEEKPWNIGLVVGPSGCGKSTIARELWPEALVAGFEWHESRSVLDGFPEDMSIKEITLLLSSVGFSSPPSWVRPFQVLSNGEQFRTTMARALAESGELLVIDEFTSVVDRTVAQVGSAAIAKTVRRRGQKFIAVTCHNDVEAWLDPDWVYEPATNAFRWRSLQGRPAIALAIYRVHHSEWRRFAPYHYLTAALNPAAKCFVAHYGDRPVAFHSFLPFFGRLKDKRKALRDHRTVVLPDFQGIGIGGAVVTHLAATYAGLGFRVFRNTGHPAEIASAMRSKDWRLIRAPSRGSPDAGGRVKHATMRLTASFEFRGTPLAQRDAERQVNQVRQ